MGVVKACVSYRTVKIPVTNYKLCSWLCVLDFVAEQAPCCIHLQTCSVALDTEGCEWTCRKRGPKHHNLQKVFRSPEREAMQRNRRSSSGSLIDTVDDDDEMEAMAKVWAHPEDLHLFPVSSFVPCNMIITPTCIYLLGT